jgi:hypothetical protein
MSRADWLKRLRETFPFASNRVSSLADAQVDVPAIHRTAYDRLLAAAAEARSRPRGGLGVLLWGDPGVGKSHLLARFASEIATDDRGLFLLVHNLLAAPRLVPGTVVRTLVARLTDRSLGRQQASAPRRDEPPTSVLYNLLYGQIRQAVPRPQGRPPGSVGKEEARRLFVRRLVETVGSELPDQNRPYCDRIAAVLFAYFLAVHRLRDPATSAEWHTHYERVLAIAEQYLNGDALDADAWETLELDAAMVVTQEPGTVDDQFLETVCLILLELARQAGQLVVICFDQVENLSDERFVELFRFNHALLDHGRNLLMITAGVRSDLVALRTRGLAPEAAWDRLAGDTIDLYFISLGAARELLETRLRSAFAANPPPADIADSLCRDPLFPLGEAWWSARVAGLIEARPRDVISWAHARWREQCQAFATDWENALRAYEATPTIEASTADDRRQGVEMEQGGVVARERDRHEESVADRGDEDREVFSRQVDDWIERRVDKKLEELRTERSRLTPDSGQLIGLLQATLHRISCGPLSEVAWVGATNTETAEANHAVLSCVEPGKIAGKQPTYDFLVKWRTGEADQAEPSLIMTTGVVVLVTDSATSTAAAYRRLKDDRQPPDRVLVVFDERRPEKLGTKGGEYRDELQSCLADKLRFVDLTFNEYSELSALEAVLADARSGDLEIEQPAGGLVRLTERDVEASYARRRRYWSLPLMRLLLENPHDGRRQALANSSESVDVAPFAP